MFTQFTRSLLLAAALLALAGSATAQRVMQVIENSYESTTFSVELPYLVPARLSVKPCEECKTDTLSLEASTRYFVGKQQLSYAEFRSFVAKNSRGMVIHFDPKTRVVTRMVVSG